MPATPFRRCRAPRLLPRLGRLLANWLPALPLVTLALAMLIVPTGMVVVQSLRSGDGIWTLDAWAETLQRKGDQRAIVTNLEACAPFARRFLLLAGAPLAWRLSRSSQGLRSVWLSLLNVGANFVVSGWRSASLLPSVPTAWSHYC